MKAILYSFLFLLCLISSCSKNNGSSCGTPSGTTTSAITNSTALLQWTTVTGATLYTVQYRQVGTSAWSTATSPVNSVTLTSLAPSTNYEWQVQDVCPGGTSSFTGSATFTSGAINIIYATFRGAIHTFVGLTGNMNLYTSGNYTQIIGAESSTHDSIAIYENGIVGGTHAFGQSNYDIADIVIGGNFYGNLAALGLPAKGSETITINGTNGSLTFNTTLYNLNNSADSIVITNGNFTGTVTTNP